VRSLGAGQVHRAHLIAEATLGGVVTVQAVAAGPSAAEVRAQLERVVSSSRFTSAPGATRLLRFLVEETLSGRGEQLKEFTLATGVFGRDASFDPKLDPAIRVEASRLRQRLEHYYLTLGRNDPVLIDLPRGAYVPHFSRNADVLHLQRDLDATRASRTRDAAGVPLLRGPWLAVLPFENLGGEADAVFAEGVTVEIMTALSRFREVHVIGRSTVLHHRDERDAAAWHRELGVDFVVAGDALRDNHRLRIHARLLDAPRGEVLWAEVFERDLATTEIFLVQDEIATRVAATVAQPRGALAAPVLARIPQRPSGRLGSYECLLRFYDYSANRSPEAHARLRDAVQESLRLETRIASLWTVASFLATDTARFGYNADGDRDAALDEALRAARRAIRLDRQDALGYHALFQAHFNRGDLRAFRRAADRALALNPNNSEILADYGTHLTMCDEWDLGMLLLRGALILNPEPPDWYWVPFFSWHFERREFDAALDMALRAQSDGFFWTHAVHAMAYEALGQHEAAHAAITRLLAVYPAFAECAEEELARWVSSKRVGPAVEMLRRAGLPAPARQA